MTWRASGNTTFKITDIQWDGEEASQRIFAWAGWDDDPQPDKARQCFFAYDDETPENKTAYKLPFCDIVDGEPVIVRRAVFAVAAVLSGARGGVDLPRDVQDDIKRKVEQIYRAMDEPSPFKSLTVKQVSDGRWVAEGWGVIFDSRDLEGERFTKATDFWMDKLGLESYPVLYDHGMHPWVKHTIIGRAKPQVKDYGVWLEIELQKSAEYEEYLAMIEKLAELGKLGVSSGAVGHLVKRAGDVITEWPIVEFSLTPTPAEPKTLGVDVIREFAGKSLTEILEQPAEAEQSAPVEDEQNDEPQAESVEPEQITNQEPTGDVKMETQIAYATETKSYRFADFLKAIRYRNPDYYPEIKAMSEGTPTAGGYLVPDQFVAQLMAVEHTALGAMLDRALRLPIESKQILIPALDQTITPTAGTSAYFGGVAVSIVSEAGAKPETTPAFKQVALTPYKLAAHTLVSDELLADSAISVEQILVQLFRKALTWTISYYMINGSGSGQPTGLLNAGALISFERAASGNAVDLADVAAMYGRNTNPANAVWIVHPTVIPSLIQLEGNVIAWYRDLSGAVPGTLLGRPIIVSDACKPAGTKGDIFFADLSQLAVALGTPSIDVSEHYKFVNDQTTWRVVQRFDCKPLLTAPINLDATNTLSPFVALDDAV